MFYCVQSEPYHIENIDFVDSTKAYEVHKEIKELSENETTRVDQISAEHLKFSTSSRHMLYSFVRHGFNPDSMMKVCLVPVIKNKTGKVGSSDKY